MTDERVQSVQAAMIKAETPKKKKKISGFFFKNGRLPSINECLGSRFYYNIFFLCFIVDIHIIMCFIMISFLNK